MKDLGAEHLAGGEGVQLLGLLNFYLEQEQRFQPREKGLSLLESTPEVSLRIGRTCRRQLFVFSGYVNSERYKLKSKNGLPVPRITLNCTRLCFCSKWKLYPV